MNVLLDIKIAGKPGEIVPVTHLPFHVAPLPLAGFYPDGASIIVSLQSTDLSYCIVVNTLNGFLESLRVAQTQAGNYRKVFLAGHLAASQNRMNPRSIHRHRFFRKDMLAGFHSSFKVLRAKMRWRRQQDDVDSTCDNLLVGVEADKTAVLPDLNFRRNLLIFLELGQAALEPVLEGISHRHEFDILVGGQGLGGCSRSSSSAANQADTEQVAAGHSETMGHTRPLGERSSGTRQHGCS